MIPPIDGWNRVDLGEVLMLVPPEGARSGRIRYLERCTPIAPLATLVARHGADRDDARKCEHFFTHEGELAAQVTVIGEADSALHLGFVLTESFYSVVTAVSCGAANHSRYRALVTQLSLRDSHHLGARPRRAIHVGPDGWEGVARGLRTDYIATGFPGNPSAVSLYPAMPRATHDARPLALLLRAHGATGRGERIDTRHGLRGARWRLATRTRSGHALSRDVIVAAHGDYVYALRADGDSDDAVAAILDNLVPFPSASERREAVIFEHWTQ